MAHFYPDIHEARIDEAYGRIKHDILLEEIPVEAEYAVTPEPVPYEERGTLSYKPIRQGEGWGKNFDCGWFHVRGRVPTAWKGSYVTLRLDLGGEILLFDEKGCPFLGLTSGSIFDNEFHKDHYHWLPCAKGGETLDLWCDVGANKLYGLDRLGDPAWTPKGRDIHGEMHCAATAMSLCRFDWTAWQLFLDLEVIRSLVRSLPAGSHRKIQVLRATSEALDFLPPERGGAATVRERLRKTVWALAPDPASVHVTAVGHAHIDTAWLWPFRETVRKVGRTWASQLGLIRRYPGYVFGASQAQLYAFCKQAYPRLYAKVKAAVAKGTWEVQGGMWVEADCNIPSGESLIRQFLTGMRFFQEEFGAAPRNLWLPDVFGYSGNLPQIMRICGIDFFLTQKLSWNRYNRFPHNSFTWRGIDGSEVVSHFPPEDTYIGNLLPQTLCRHNTKNAEAGLVDTAISLFGIGDGGGGPREEHVEHGLRAAHLNGCPPVRFGFAQKALNRIKAQRANLDTWVGELYFEMHRGTYTTQARQKRLNRRAEEALRAAEMLCAAAMCKGAAYPAEAFRDLWRDVCLCQFHDVIPGSSIHRVYDEAGAIVERAMDRARALGREAASSFLRREADALTFFNPSSTTYVRALRLPEGWTGAVDAAGADLPVQREAASAVALVVVPPHSFATVRRSKAKAPAAVRKRATAFPVVLENGLVRYSIDAKGRVCKALDKATNRLFVTPAEPGNRLALYEDRPTCYDAWDIEEYATRMPVAEPEDLSMEVEKGPVRQRLVIRFRLGASAFEQVLSLEAGSARLDVETTVDWKESHKLCRVAFPVDVRADEARFEIQYGTVARATHDNTKWQYAQFESVGHRYADLSEEGFGVALLNDSKYGYRVKGHELSLSLLRAPTEPDPVADVGRHRFVYALLPHAGTLAQSDAVTAAAAVLNQGVERFDGFAADGGSPLPVSVEGRGVELAVVKKAEDSGDLVIRVVERRGCRTSFTLRADGPAVATPCLATELADTGKPVTLPLKRPLKPFEIRTYRVRRAK